MSGFGDWADFGSHAEVMKLSEGHCCDSFEKLGDCLASLSLSFHICKMNTKQTLTAANDTKD
jgi:hypothetical protein